LLEIYFETVGQLGQNALVLQLRNAYGCDHASDETQIDRCCFHEIAVRCPASG